MSTEQISFDDWLARQGPLVIASYREEPQPCDCDFCKGIREAYDQGLSMKDKPVDTPATFPSYEYRERFACKVCGNVPDKYGMLDHGRGCYTQSSYGGGSSYVELNCEHERTNNHGDACLDCGKVFVAGSWS